jgi:hypothetical protein
MVDVSVLHNIQTALLHNLILSVTNPSILPTKPETIHMPIGTSLLDKKQNDSIASDITT